MKHLTKIKTSVFSRGLKLTQMTAITGAKAFGHGVAHLLRDKESKNQKWQEFLTSQARNLSKDLGELKGSLMKAGQMISMYGELFLPDEANDFLKTLQSKSPPVQFSEIEKILKLNLSKEKLDQIEIDPDPIGAASLGQVHKARIKETGEFIALKVQYPGVAKAILSDLRALRSMLSMLQLLPSDFQTDVLFDEVKQMLLQECDYRQEIENTKRYHTQFSHDQRLVIPRVYEEYCGPQVIATSFEKGVSPDDPMVTALSQDRRNALAMTFLEVYFRELFEEGFVQTDPHLGNYKIRLRPDGQDQLVLLDFGALRSYEKNFLNAYQRMIKAALMSNTAALEQASLDLRFIQESDDPNLRKMFEDFCLMTVEPFLEFGDSRSNKQFMDHMGIYDWKKSDLPKRLTKIGIQIIRQFPLRTPPREVIFLDRKTGGVFVFLSVLRARVHARPLLLKYLEPISIA